ncbi:MAG: 16S rRNA (cytosine(1402)-N(4))-methyltransferase [Betaproteobacteria bacterium RIFCSPLOWO2_12_FULL_62_13]|nr:MAG: 16S rRNA (cytosine(1402)-N(4))-methyltransferase [Betaproteobacteria bacterium RIFCSPLOWO2_12_FULL_62_13]
MSLGSHTAVLSEQAVEGLNVRADGAYVDCTFGRGGHSRLILVRLGSGGRLIALDRDPDAVRAGGEIGDGRFTILHGAFGQLKELLGRVGVKRVDGILLDLGVSSPQLDDAQRGFSFRVDAPLDMRMDTSRGITAAQWLATATESEIREVIRSYGEERFAKQIAAALIAARSRGPIGTTRQLAALVAEAVPSREPRQDPATRTFQAIRIHINQELEELSLVLPQCIDLLAPAGRLVVVSFHSLEDRIVKRFLRCHAAGDRLPPRLPVRAQDIAPPRLKLIGRAQRPGASEIAANPRARSAVMRVAERIGAAPADPAGAAG